MPAPVWAALWREFVLAKTKKKAQSRVEANALEAQKKGGEIARYPTRMP